MIWYVMAILVVVVLGVVAAVAAGAGGTMPEAFDDRIDSRVPAQPLVEGDVVRVRFPLALRGYRMEEVDRLLDILGAQLADQQATIDELRAEQASFLRNQQDRVGEEAVSTARFAAGAATVGTPLFAPDPVPGPEVENATVAGPGDTPEVLEGEESDEVRRPDRDPQVP